MIKKEKITSALATVTVWVLITLFLPIIILVLLCQLLYTPIGYVRFKRSLYQRDFPRRYSLLCGRHTDDAPYTAVRLRGLPVEYVRGGEGEDYSLPGKFFFGTTELIFAEPLFFDEGRGCWLLWPETDGEECDNEECDDGEGSESTEDCLTVAEARRYCVALAEESYPERGITDAVFFCSLERARSFYGKAAAELLSAEEGVVTYRRRELGEAIEKFIKSRECS